MAAEALRGSHKPSRRERVAPRICTTGHGQLMKKRHDEDFRRVGSAARACREAWARPPLSPSPCPSWQEEQRGHHPSSSSGSVSSMPSSGRVGLSGPRAICP